MSSYEEIMSRAKGGGGISKQPVSRDGSMINNVLMVKSAMAQIVEFLRNELPKLPLNVQSSDATNVSRDIVALNRNLQSLEQFLESSDSVIGTALPQFGEVIGELKKTVDQFSESARCVEDCISELQSPVVNVENVRVQNLGEAVSVLEKILITLASRKEPDSVKISNLKDIKFPATTTLPKEIVDCLKKLSLLSDDAENPIAVRLSNGKEFVDSISEGVKEGVKIITHGSSGNAFIDANGSPVKPQLDSSGKLPVAVSASTISTGTVTSVDDTASSTTILAANSSRKGFIIFNDSTVVLYLKLGATASTTSFTYKLNPSGTLNEPNFPYTGVIDGIWASNASGAARITELS